jgi:general secretion pathway protein E
MNMQPNPRPDLVGRAFGEVCVELHGLSANHVGEALDAQVAGRATGSKARVGELLVERKRLTVEQVLRALAVQLDLSFITDIASDKIPDELIRAVPIALAKQQVMLPLSRTEYSVVVACADPLDSAALDELRMLLECEVDLVVGVPDTITAAINNAYDRLRAKADAALADVEEGGSASEIKEEAVPDLIDAADDDEAPIIRLVNSLFGQAVKERASDIHIEPFESNMLVRFRVDGVLKEIIKPPKRFQNTILSRVKIMAGLNIAEKRLPQDGRIRLKIAGKDIDVRVSTVPSTYGERIVMRLLDRSSVLRDLDTVGFSPRNYAIITQLIEKSHGIILVTGPTGSGKTSTLYGCLAKINAPDLNILTIEDPVEYQLRGIGQVQVNAKIGLTFAGGLRAFLRQDPDVIMVGEIRDKETAEIAIQASLTGHLVMSTVHTNDAAGAVTRLVDMGVQPFLVASSLIGVVAQRLVRTICSKCRDEYAPSAEELRTFGIGKGEVKKLWRGKGCDNCQGTGYRGRTGIYELMLVDEDIRKLVISNVDSNQIKQLARDKGMRTLMEDGLDKITAGITTAEEISRVTQEDSMSMESFA